MDEFDVIHTGFNKADETINFGARPMGSENLYEIATLACFKSSEEYNYSTAVSIGSVVHNDNIIICINKSLKIFTDEINTVAYNAVFGSQIDTFCVSPNGQYLLICLQSGIVHVLDMQKSGSECIYKGPIIENEPREQLFVGSYIEHASEDFLTFITVSCLGQIHRVQLTFNEDETENTTITHQLVCDVSCSIKTCSFSNPNLFINGSKLIVLDTENGQMISDVNSDLKSIYPIGHKFIGLTNKGVLVNICWFTMICFPVGQDTLFDDILVISNKNDDIHILGVTKKDEQGCTYIQLLTYPDFSKIFSILFNQPLHLCQMESITDEILFISEIVKESTITELRLQRIYETEPDLRVARLIKRGRFEEAEAFAKTFNINPNIVKKARAQIFVDKTSCTPDDIQQLLDLLTTIDDDIFKLHCCMSVDCDTDSDLRKMLHFGSTMKISHSENKEAGQVLQSELIKLLLKFDTYIAVYEDYEMHTWLTFTDCDMIEELKTFLRNFQIEKAIILFSRFDRESMSSLSEENVEEILSILNRLPSNSCQPFLAIFLPLTVRHRPDVLPVLIKWLRNRIFQIERREPLDFPEAGIRFAEEILKLLKGFGDDGGSLAHNKCVLDHKRFEELSDLMVALKDIETIKNNFRVKIPLPDYLMGPKTVIRLLLNMQLDPVDFEVMLKEFLCTFILKHGYQSDEIFIEEIRNLLKYTEECWIGTVPVILKFISSVPVKLTAIKEILEIASVPWGESVREIGRSALNYAHPLTESIKDILEDEPRLIVLRNPKYNIKDWNAFSIADFKYVVNRIVYIGEPSMVEDILQLCKSAEETREANLILILHFIKKGDLKKALSILDKNTPEEIYSLINWFVTFASHCRTLQKLKENLNDILNSFDARLCKHSETIGLHDMDMHMIRTVKNVYNIERHFQVQLSIADMYHPVKKLLMLDELLNRIVGDFEGGSLDFKSLIDLSDKLATYFSLERDDVLLKLCDKIGNFELLLNTAERLVQTESTAKNLFFVAVLILQHIGSHNREPTNMSTDSFLHNSSLFLTNDSGDQRSVFLRGCKILEEVCTRAVSVALPEEQSAVMRVVNWTDNCFFLNRSDVNFSKLELFKDVYVPTAAFANNPFLALRDVFRVYCRYIELYADPDARYITYFNSGLPPLSKDDLVQEILNLPLTINSLFSENQYLTACNVVTSLYKNLFLEINSNEQSFNTLYTIIFKQCLPKVLNMVVSAKHLDTTAFYNLMLMYKKKFVNPLYLYLKAYKRQPAKFGSIAYVGVKLMDLYDMKTKRDELVDIIQTSKWWKKFENLGLEYDAFFKFCSNSRLEQLMALDSFDINSLKEYCEDYNLDTEVYSLEYLKSIITEWKPDTEYTTDLGGTKHVIIKNDETKLFEKCMMIVNAIKDKESVFNLTKKAWEAANFYYYEIFMCILKIQVTLPNAVVGCRGLRERDLAMLDFLKKYRRHSAPSNTEKEEWHGLFPLCPFLDPLSEFRLPFSKILFTNDIWRIITDEINLKTYKCWFSASAILTETLNTDDICTYAIKGLDSSGMFSKHSIDSWLLYPEYEDLVLEVAECAKHMSDLERVTAVVYHVTNKMPRGADMVNFAELSYKYALEYKNKFPNSPKVEGMFIKVKQRYYSSAATHVLYSNKLQDIKYLGLVALPTDLIKSLYMDERISKNCNYLNIDCPDINKTVDELASLFALDITKIRYDILNDWLDNCMGDIDTENSFVSCGKNDRTKNDECVRRASYLCTSGDINFWRTYLLSESLNKEEKTYSFRANALRCYCAISSRDIIEDESGRTYPEILDFVNKLTVLSSLDSLGIMLTIELLDQYNKKDLLKRVSQFAQPLGISTMATICITYSIYDLKYWEFIVNEAVKFDMINDLKVYLEYLKEKCYKKFYINAWQAVINDAFCFEDSCSEEDIFEVFINGFLMIESCPVRAELNVEHLIKKIMPMKREFAAVLALLLSDEKKKSYMKEFSNSASLQKDLDKLINRGITGAKQAKLYLATLQY